MSNSLQNKTKLLLIAAGVVALAPLSTLVANDQHGAGIRKTRHEEYEKLGDAFKVIRDQVRADTPDAAAIKSSAKIVHDASVNQYKWFPAGSGPESGAKTRAKAEIWSKPKDFEAAQKLFADQAAKLNAAAQSGDVSAVKAQFGEVGKSCKNCHDNFRTPED